MRRRLLAWLAPAPFLVALARIQRGEVEDALAVLDRMSQQQRAAIARALAEAAAWVGAPRVVVDEVVPSSLRGALQREVASLEPH